MELNPKKLSLSVNVTADEICDPKLACPTMLDRLTLKVSLLSGNWSLITSTKMFVLNTPVRSVTTLLANW